MKVIKDKAIAFVRYTLRASAEFAKEAMTDQSLDSNNEVYTFIELIFLLMNSFFF